MKTLVNAMYPCSKLTLLDASSLLDYLNKRLSDDDSQTRTQQPEVQPEEGYQRSPQWHRLDLEVTYENIELHCPIEKLSLLAWSAVKIAKGKHYACIDTLLGIVANRLQNKRELATVSYESLTSIAKATTEANSKLPLDTVCRIFDVFSRAIVVQMGGGGSSQDGQKVKLRAIDASALFQGYAKLVAALAGRRLHESGQLKQLPPPHNPRWFKEVQDIIGSYDDVHRTALRLLNKAVVGAMPAMDQRSVMMAAWSCAMLQERWPVLIDRIKSRSLQLMEDNTVDAQALGTILWSFSMLHHDDPLLWEGGARAAMNLLQNKEERNYYLTSQFLSMMGYSLALMDRWSGPNAKQLLPMLAHRAIEIIDEFRPQGLCNIAWAFVVAEYYDAGFFELWRSKFPTLSSEVVSVSGFAQVHQIELALSLEAPHIGRETPRDAARFFESIYQAGRSKVSAKAEWGTMQNSKPRIISRYQKEVYTIVNSIGIDCSMEYFDPVEEYSIDIAVPAHRLAIEADGPTHYALNTKRALGPTVLKHRVLEKLGWKVLPVPYFDWNDLTDEAEKRNYLREKFAVLGVSPTEIRPVATVSPVQTGPTKSNETDQSGQAENELPHGAEEDKHEEDDDDIEGVRERAARFAAIKYSQGQLSKANALSKALQKQKRTKK